MSAAASPTSKAAPTESPSTDRTTASGDGGETTVVGKVESGYISRTGARYMRHTLIRRSLNVAVVLLALLYGACQKSDTVAPDGSTINLAATPATILLNGGVQASPVNV